MTKWKNINNKRSYSHLSYFNSRPIPVSLSNLDPIPMRIPWEVWESCISHSHAHLYSKKQESLKQKYYLTNFAIVSMRVKKLALRLNTYTFINL